MLMFLSLLRRNLEALTKKHVCFKTHELVIFHGQSLLLGAMAWSLRFGAQYVASLKENKIVIS